MANVRDPRKESPRRSQPKRVTQIVPSTAVATMVMLRTMACSERRPRRSGIRPPTAMTAAVTTAAPAIAGSVAKRGRRGSAGPRYTPSRKKSQFCGIFVAWSSTGR